MKKDEESQAVVGNLKSGHGLGNLPPSLKNPKRLLIILLIAILAGLLFLAAPTIKRYIADKSHQTPKAGETLLDKVNALNAEGKFDEAQKLLESDPSAKDSKDSQMLLAMTQENAKDYQKALETYQSIEVNFGLDKRSAQGIARAAEALGNKTLAAEYYDKAADLVIKDTNNPVAEDEANYLREKARQLRQ